jgi:glycosyltransferase involved in cell wall biosynthesis
VHGESAERAAVGVAAAGIKSMYMVCDLMHERMVAATDATVATTDYLRDLHPPELRHRIEVIHDGIERPDARKVSWTAHRGSRQRPLRAVLVTSRHLLSVPVLAAPPEWLEVTIIGRYPRAEDRLRRARVAYWDFASLRGTSERVAYLRFLVSRRIRCVKWDPEFVYEAMVNADVGIIPIDDSEPDSAPGGPMSTMRSENRLTMKMCVGLPVVATTVPSYKPVIEQGRNGFLVDAGGDWMGLLSELRDPEFRRAMGERARDSVIDRYSKDAQARKLIDLLRRLIAA